MAALVHGVILNARNCRTEYDRNTVNVSFSTDNRMVDHLYISSRSTDVKVVRQCQVKRKT